MTFCSGDGVARDRKVERRFARSKAGPSRCRSLAIDGDRQRLAPVPWQIRATEPHGQPRCRRHKQEQGRAAVGPQPAGPTLRAALDKAPPKSLKMARYEVDFRKI